MVTRQDIRRRIMRPHGGYLCCCVLLGRRRHHPSPRPSPRRGERGQWPLPAVYCHSRDPKTTSTMTVIWAIATVVIKELLRRKDFYVLFILTALITLMMDRSTCSTTATSFDI